MALWTMTPVGERVLVVPAHRAYAAAMTEDDPLTPGDSERRKADLREKDRGMGRPPYTTGLARSPSVTRSLWGRTGATRRSQWPGATSAWSWWPRIWLTTMTTRAGACTAGR